MGGLLLLYQHYIPLVDGHISHISPWILVGLQQFFSSSLHIPCKSCNISWSSAIFYSMPSSPVVNIYINNHKHIYIYIVSLWLLVWFYHKFLPSLVHKHIFYHWYINIPNDVPIHPRFIRWFLLKSLPTLSSAPTPTLSRAASKQWPGGSRSSWRCEARLGDLGVEWICHDMIWITRWFISWMYIYIYTHMNWDMYI